MRSTRPRRRRWRPNSRRPANRSHHRPLQEAIPVDPPSCDDSLQPRFAANASRHLQSDRRRRAMRLSAVRHLKDFGSRHQQLGRNRRCIASVTEDIDNNRCAALGECIEANLFYAHHRRTPLSRPLRKIINCGLAHLNLKSRPTFTLRRRL